ncbi:MAG: DUF222 domain-containing protein [Gordonia amarae]
MAWGTAHYGSGSDSIDLPVATLPEGREGVAWQMVGDNDLSALELVEILAHCASTVAAAQYRMMHAASLIHDQYAEDYAYERSLVDSGERTPTELMDSVAAGGDPCSDFGPDGLERAIAEVGAILTVTPSRAKALIVAGDAARYRLVFTASTLAEGRIDLDRFLIAVKRTDLCSPEAIDDIDAHLAGAILDNPPMSTRRFTTLVDSLIAKWDPEADRRQTERNKADRKVTVTPDRFARGNSRLGASLPAMDGAAVDAKLNAMAVSVHSADPRTKQQRRADALVALAKGRTELPCLCEACTAIADDHPECAGVGTSEVDPPSTDTATGLPLSEANPLGARPVFHIVVNLSTLLGLDNDPGFLDGHGIIDAATMRSMLAEADRSYINPHARQPDRQATRYTPGKKLISLVRAGELCCTFPGCNAPVWTADVDHTTPFDHRNPTQGGQTVLGNLKPLCRFHHRIKTFTSWQDYQDDLGHIRYQSPTGHEFHAAFFTGRTLFPGLIPRRDPDHPARATLDVAREARIAKHADDQRRWDEANPPPF